MTNHECIIALLATHRAGRGWTDDAVARDLLAQLGLDPDGEASHAAPAPDPARVTEDEVKASETAADVAVDKAKVARGKLDGQIEADAQAKVEVATDQAKAEHDAKAEHAEKAERDAKAAHQAKESHAHEVIATPEPKAGAPTPPYAKPEPHPAPAPIKPHQGKHGK